MVGIALMINWIENVITHLVNLVRRIGEMKLDSGLNTIIGIASVISLGGASVRLLCKFTQILIGKRPIESLYKALVGYSVSSKMEITYQIRSYRAPRFRDNKTIKQLLSHIKKVSGDRRLSTAMFSVIGNPACGKTTTMRYLYCQLSRKRKCVYFQMQKVMNMEKLSEYLGKQKLVNNIPDRASVIAFFDGLDEAYEFFHQECSDSVEKAFRTIFFEDPEPKINEIFQKHNLSLVCVVVSFRPEFLEKSVKSLETLQRGNVYQKVYEIMSMSDKDVIKIFKSLKVLKRLDARLDDDERRHQNRFPPRWQEHKYIRLLRDILRDNPNCIFQYPMYIRYAYAFMQEYLDRQAVKNKLIFNNNISVSFDILVNAIIKWEFHVYYKDVSSKRNKEELDSFTKKMEQCAQEIAVYLQLKKITSLSRDEFKQIIQQHFQDEAAALVMAHCFMVSGDGDRAMQYAFCHDTFREYFLAKYLFENADYVFRKECFCSNDKSEYLMHMYHSILCQNKELNKRISRSISLDGMEYLTDEIMTPESYVLLNEKKEIRLKGSPEISIVEIYEYLPYICDFVYRGNKFIQEEIETVLDTGRLDLEDTIWYRLDYAEGVVPPERVVKLNISWMPIAEVEALEKYTNLKYLYMRFSENDDSIFESICDILHHRWLNEIHIYSEMGIECVRIYILFCNGKLHVQRVYVQTPSYSFAHKIMYELNQRSEEAGQPLHFYLSVRSNKDSAKEKYLRRSFKKNLTLLTAVFELEMEEGGILSLTDKCIEGTLWNGLSLIEYYADVDDENAYQICCRMESYINRDDTELSVYFGKVYGNILFERHQYKRARLWLLNSYLYGSNYNCGQIYMANLGIKLYEAWTCSKTDGAEKIGAEIEESIMKLPDYQEDWMYARLLEIHCVREFIFWDKGEPQPENIWTIISRYKDIADNFVDCFDAVYFEMIYANRTENQYLGEKILKNLGQELKRTFEGEKDWKHCAWTKYHTQKLYYFFLKDDKDMVLHVIDKMLKYQYGQQYIPEEMCNAIYSFYQSDVETTSLYIDRHILWNELIF